MDLTLSPNEVIAVAGIGITAGTTLFHAVLYLGKLVTQVDRHELKIDDHEKKLEDHQNKIDQVRGLDIWDRRDGR